MITLQNHDITLLVSEQGAEMHSLQCNDHEYLWNGDATFWNRHAPVLFPIVGRVWDGEYRVEGRSYQLGQHGFARDMEFAVIEQEEDEVWLELRSTEETLTRYPYAFSLRIGYKLEGKTVRVMWHVENPSEEEMFFQIGAHPAFYWPGLEDGQKNSAEPYMEQELGYFEFDSEEPLVRSTITEKGCIDPEQTTTIATESGMLKLTPEVFAKDALVLEHDQVHSVSLLTKEKVPYLRVDFPLMPVVGLWSTPGKHAPFVCIEPWCGRCDDVHYEGEFKDKKWINSLAAGKTFHTEYEISIL